MILLKFRTINEKRTNVSRGGSLEIHYVLMVLFSILFNKNTLPGISGGGAGMGVPWCTDPQDPGL